MMVETQKDQDSEVARGAGPVFPFSVISDFECETQAQSQVLIDRFVADGGTGEALMEQLNARLRSNADFAQDVFHDQFVPILRLIPDFSSCLVPVVAHAVNHRASELLAVLIAQGANLHLKLNGDPPLVLAATDDEEMEGLPCARLLLDAGVDVDSTNGHGETALMHAAARVQIGFMQTLLVAGADVSRRDSLGRTALHWALGMHARRSGKRLQAAEILLDAGAAVDARDFERNTPLHGLASACRLDVEGAKAAIDLLLRRGADIEARNDGELTPLLCAVGDTKIGDVLFEHLLQAGADLNVKVRGEVHIDRLAVQPAKRALLAVRMAQNLEAAMTPRDMPAAAGSSCNPGAL